MIVITIVNYGYVLKKKQIHQRLLFHKFQNKIIETLGLWTHADIRLLKSIPTTRV